MVFALLPALLLGGCTSEDLYTSRPGKSDSDAVLIAPYFDSVAMRFSVAIEPGSSAPAGGEQAPKPVPVPAPPPAAPAMPATPNGPTQDVNARGTQDKAGPPKITIAAITIPTSRSYIYLERNDLFSNTANVGLTTDGLLSSSDTSSTQQVSAILSEIVQTAVGLATGKNVNTPPPKEAGPKLRAACFEALKAMTSSAGFYKISDRITNSPSTDIPVSDAQPAVNGISVTFDLHLDVPLAVNPDSAAISSKTNGVAVYYPVPSLVWLSCKAEGFDPAQITPAMSVNLYFDREFIHPKRDFFTGAQDSYTFNAGIITGHKYSDQSPVKTVVDTITSPIRALLPSVTVTTSTQVQSNGTSSKTVTTQDAPSKSQ